MVSCKSVLDVPKEMHGKFTPVGIIIMIVSYKSFIAAIVYTEKNDKFFTL